jgi:cysteine dioxygenase
VKINCKLTELFAALDRAGSALSLESLLTHLRGVQLGACDVAELAHFNSNGYCRNLVHKGPAYQALILCWRSGQRSPIHDHRGAACGVHVIEGVATETVFELSPCGLVYPTLSRNWAAGAVYGSFDADIHQMGNLQPAGRDLITLHVYSPSLERMRTYKYDAGECAGEVTTWEPMPTSISGSVVRV